MSVQFFGQYLLQHRYIRADQLLAAIELQREKNLKFGEYATANGYVSAANVEKIKQLQQTKDIYFGEAAIELKILTADEVDNILQRQKADHVLLGDALVQLGHIDSDAVNKALDEFKKEQKEYAATEIAVPVEANELRAITGTSIAITTKMLLRVAGILAKPGKISTKAIPISPDSIATRVAVWGKKPLKLTLCTPPEVAKQIARAFFADEVDREDQALIEDANREFINIAVGNVVTKLVQGGETLELEPPETIALDDIGATGIFSEIGTPYGTVALVISR